MKKTISSLFILSISSIAIFSSAQTSLNAEQVTMVSATKAVANDSVSLDKKAEKPEMVNGSVMYASKDFIDNMSNNESLATFHDILSKAGLAETLKGKGEFTVFAPTTEAFAKADPAKMDSLMVSHHQNELTAMITYHMVSGKLNLKDMIKSIRKNDGKTVLMTVSGSALTLTLQNEQLVLTDENGGQATITQSDISQKNGTLYIIDHVLMPKKKV